MRKPRKKRKPAWMVRKIKAVAKAYDLDSVQAELLIKDLVEFFVPDGKTFPPDEVVGIYVAGVRSAMKILRMPTVVREHSDN